MEVHGDSVEKTTITYVLKQHSLSCTYTIYLYCYISSCYGSTVQFVCWSGEVGYREGQIEVDIFESNKSVEW